MNNYQIEQIRFFHDLVCELVVLIFRYFVCPQKFSGKSKSSHDLSNDPRLSSETGGKAVEMGTDDRAKKVISI